MGMGGAVFAGADHVHRTWGCGGLGMRLCEEKILETGGRRGDSNSL
jgi:hypothetical protein